jgi:hypothetical protein
MPIARPGVWGIFPPFVALRVETEVGPEEFQPLRFIDGIWMLVGRPVCLSSLFSLSSCARNDSSRLISSSMRFEKRYRNIHLPRFTRRRQPMSNKMLHVTYFDGLLESQFAPPSVAHLRTSRHRSNGFLRARMSRFLSEYRRHTNGPRFREC